MWRETELTLSDGTAVMNSRDLMTWLTGLLGMIVSLLAWL
jgi:hypothetical protein